jgi:large subunit ribosomal protein L17
MRHKKSVNHLGRKSAHRKSMMANMASSLIVHKRIETTTAKAKALKRYIEPLITRSKDDSTHSRRIVFSYLQDKEAVTELFREVSAKVGDRPGGYTRIIKLGSRQGDNADMCLIELVDYNENLLAEKASAKKAAGRRRRGSKKKAKDEAAPLAAAGAAEAAEAVTEPEVTESSEVVVEAEAAEATEAVEEAEVAESEEVVEEVEAAVEAEETAAEEVVEEEAKAEEATEDPAGEAEAEVKAESDEETTDEDEGQEAEDEDKKE